MKRITYLTLTITAGLALLQPLSVFSADNPNDKKFQKKGGPAPGPAHANVVKPNFVKPVVHTAVTPRVTQNKTFNKNFSNHTNVVKPTVNNNVVQSRTRNVTNTTVNKAVVTSGGRGGNGQFTRANNYGGRWTAGGNFHSDWNHGQEHDWNGHHYRWYDGGWLIVDGGFWPVPGGPVVYQGGSLVAAAQQQLANNGYYNGPIDGDAGPGTRSAIANFQNDNGLDPTGHLNYPTRQALGLQ